MGFRIGFNSQLINRNRSRRMKIAVQMRKGLNGVFYVQTRAGERRRPSESSRVSRCRFAR